MRRLIGKVLCWIGRHRRSKASTVESIIIATHEGLIDAIRDIKSGKPDLALITLETIEPFLNILVNAIKAKEAP